MSRMELASSAIKAEPQAEGYLLHDTATLAQIARDAVKWAGRLGKGRASAIAHEAGGFTIKAGAGDVMSAERQGRQLLSVTVIDAHRRGTASTGIFTPDAIRSTVERAAAIALQLEPDPDGDFPDPESLAKVAAKIPLFAPSMLSARDLGDVARSIEQGALEAAAKQGDDIRVVEAAAVSTDERWARAIDGDFLVSGSSSMQNRWLSAIATRDERMASAYWMSVERRTECLEASAALGAKAVERAARKLGGRSLETRTSPVLIDATIAAALVQDLVGALSGRALYQNATFLAGSVGKAALAAHLDLTEDPFEPFGLASGVCDEEGIAGARRSVVTLGEVTGYFLSTLAARKLGMASTGNAGGPWNLTLSSRKTNVDDDLPAMLNHLGTGLWVTEFLGGSTDLVTGNYSRAVTGFWVENGLIVHPVEDITIGGNLKDMLLGIVHVGSDVHRSGLVRTGSLLIDAMKIAGR